LCHPGIKRSLYWVLEKLAKQGIVDPLIEAGTIAVLFEVVQKNPTPSDLSLFALFEILEYGGVEQFVSTIGTKVLFEKLDSPSFWESALSRSLLSVLARKGEHQTVVPVLLDYSKADNWAKLEHSVGCLSRILEETYERLEEKQILDIIASCIVALQNGDTDTRYVGISGLEFASSEPALRDKISGGTVTLVIKSLKDEDPDIRYYAAKTLGNLKERSAVEELKLLLDDLEPVEGARYTKLRRLARSVSDGAREALEKIKGRDSQDE
jgi:hypothetical protein